MSKKESSTTNIQTGEIVKIKGKIKKHPDFELLQSPPFKRDKSPCIFRKWGIEEGKRDGFWYGELGVSWEHVYEDNNGIPALLSKNGSIIRLNMDCIKKPFFIGSNIPYHYYKENFKKIKSFLDNSEYNLGEEKPYRIRGYMNTIKPEDKIIVIGRINKTDDIKDPASFTMGSKTNEIIVTNWSFSKLIKRLIFRIFEFMYIILVISTGFYIALAESISQINSEFIPHLMLINISILFSFVLLHNLWKWMTRIHPPK